MFDFTLKLEQVLIQAGKINGCARMGLFEGLSLAAGEGVRLASGGGHGPGLPLLTEGGNLAARLGLLEGRGPKFSSALGCRSLHYISK